MNRFYKLVIITFCCLLVAGAILAGSTLIFYNRPRDCDTSQVLFARSTTVEDNIASLRLSVDKDGYYYHSYKLSYRVNDDGVLYAYLTMRGCYADHFAVESDADGYFDLEIPIREGTARLILQGENSQKTIWIAPED